MCHDLNLCCPNSLTASSPLHTAVFRVESNDLTGAVPDVICNEFNKTFPAFVADCTEEIECPCCMFCCEDLGMCQCQFESIGLGFLCSEYSLSTSMASRTAGNNNT
jgi:hypothetical protein